VLIQLEHKKNQETNLLQNQQLKGLLDCHSIQLHQQYLKAIDDRLIQQNAHVQELRDQLDKKRQALTEILKEKKTLEKLREIYEAEAIKRELKYETKIIDDITITRYHRKES
jgi:flagellar export protein FliJ